MKFNMQKKTSKNMNKVSSKKTSKRPNKRTKKKKSKIKKFFTVVLFLIITCIVGFGAYSYYCLYMMSHGGSSNISSNNANDNNNVSVVEPKKDESVNILVLGVDIGTVGSTNPNDPKRTDTMMLMHYNPDEERVDIVSIPRDTMVNIDGKTQKINAAHAIGGVNYSIDAVEDLLDVQINYYVKVNYEGFRQIIDAIGGVDMPIKYNMYYDDPGQNLHIHFQKGTTVHLDGKKAEEFFRWRENNDGTGLATGDIGRIDNQHFFIQKVIEKVKSPSIIFKLKNILSIIPKYISTNMKPDEIIKYGLDIIKIDKENIKITTLKGDGQYINDVSYYIYDPAKNQEILDSIHDIKPMSVSRDQIKIKVLNCTNKVGLAANYCEYLNKKGYSNTEAGNGEAKDSTYMVVNRDYDDDVMDNIKNEFNIVKVEKGEAGEDDFDIVVYLGEDHDYIK